MLGWFRGLKLNQKFVVTTLLFVFIPIFGLVGVGLSSIKKNAVDHSVKFRNSSISIIDKMQESMPKLYQIRIFAMSDGFKE